MSLSRARFLPLAGLIAGLTFLVPAVHAAEQYVTRRDVLYRTAFDGSDEAYARQQCRLDVYYPEGADGFATVVWFHGGNLEEGSRFIPRSLMEQGIAVVTATYRLSPRVKAPAYIEDAAAAVAWTFEHIEELGGSPNRIFVSGHSAGGYLAGMVGLDPRWLARHGLDADRIAGVLPLSGQSMTHATIRAERGLPRGLPVIDEYAPIAHARAEAPPLVLITGDRQLELPGRYEENAYLRSVMQAAGHRHTVLYELEGFDHGTMVEPGSHLIVEHVRAFLAKEAEPTASSR